MNMNFNCKKIINIVKDNLLPKSVDYEANSFDLMMIANYYKYTD